VEFVATLPVSLLALLIFAVRIVDVSIGTLRTISVVQGRLALSVVLGFFEVLIWIAALSQVIVGVSHSPFLIFAYAGGFATGNAVGIMIEQRLALGAVVVRFISPKVGLEITAALRESGYRATTFEGAGRDGPVTLIYATCERSKLYDLLQVARTIEPHVFYTVEPVQQQSEGLARALPHPTGWRAIFKKK
jgi:uncharacterized protein YebE (UPF0316 family)